jgi:hypothetical protein
MNLKKEEKNCMNYKELEHTKKHVKKPHPSEEKKR